MLPHSLEGMLTQAKREHGTRLQGRVRVIGPLEQDPPSQLAPDHESRGDLAGRARAAKICLAGDRVPPTLQAKQRLSRPLHP